MERPADRHGQASDAQRRTRGLATGWRRTAARLLDSPSHERRLVLRAIPVLAVIRLALWVLPIRIVLRLTGWARDRRGRVPADRPRARDIAQAVRRASRVVPRANCLPQAMAGQILLGRTGYESEMRIGVHRNPERGFEAHAWLEHSGEVILGELPDLARFVPMPSLERYLGRQPTQ